MNLHFWYIHAHTRTLMYTCTCEQTPTYSRICDCRGLMKSTWPPSCLYFHISLLEWVVKKDSRQFRPASMTGIRYAHDTMVINLIDVPTLSMELNFIFPTRRETIWEIVADFHVCMYLSINICNTFSLSHTHTHTHAHAHTHTHTRNWYTCVYPRTLLCTRARARTHTHAMYHDVYNVSHVCVVY